VAIGEIAHETNTFCPETTPLSSFRDHAWHTGAQILRSHRGTRSYIGGMIDGADSQGFSLVPTLVTSAVPSGTIQRAAYRTMRDDLVERIAAADGLDGICLSLHGAGTAEGVDDIEADILRAIRARVGRRLPIAVTLDLHGNITAAMAEASDGLFGVNFYPHVDMYERGVEAMGFLQRMFGGAIRPHTWVERLPMMIPTFSTDLEPMGRLNTLCWEMERRPGVLECAIFHGFAYTDVPAVAVSVVAIGDGSVEPAREAAREVAAALWDAREELRPRSLTPAAAIAEAQRHPAGPIVINDTSDNPGGGAPGDSTHLLAAMLAANLRDAAFGVLCDPESADAAHRAGEGAKLALRLGGKSDGGRREPLHGLPLAVTARVARVTNGRFRLTTPMGRGGQVDMGPMACLVVGGLEILVSSRRQQVFDDEVFRLHGIDVRQRQVVAVKSSNHFRAGFAPLATAIVTADAPGATTLRLDGFPYQRIPRPIWPLDETARYV